MADSSKSGQEATRSTVPPQQKPSPAVAPPPAQVRIDNIPIWLCWALLAGSVTILILQIWNYFS